MPMNERVRNGQSMPGVFEVDHGIPITQAIEDILLRLLSRWSGFGGFEDYAKG